ncbi:MAG TPA: methyltransferase domain-containing protein [Ignavibacteriales bacterium]|nr:methyltransferase domain-containing protein [Ignavibacteriales bacterium]
MKEMWESRYNREEYYYGTEPNEYLKKQLGKLKPGALLLLGEGEGRNAVYAAKNGWNVTAVDFSEAAKTKALLLAEKNSVQINFITADLNNFIPQSEAYDAVGLIFIHLPEELRIKTHQNAVSSLKQGGHIVLQAYDHDQLLLGKDSGGPKDINLLYTLEDIYTDFHELEIAHFSKELVYLDEGPFHHGEGSVIMYTGKKIPA